MKILLSVNKNVTALQYFRQLLPHTYLQDNSEDINIEIAENNDNVTGINEMCDEQLSKYQIVHFIRCIGNPNKDNSEDIVNRLHRLGCKVVFDIDDYWIIPKWHKLYLAYKTNDYSNKIIKSIKLADVVTTTTNTMASLIEKINPNVHVIQNAIDPLQPQFNHVKIDSPRIRFGWIGGTFHLNDIELMRESLKIFWNKKELYDNAQLCLGGFNFSKNNDGTITGSEYIGIEKILTNNYKPFKYDIDYMEYLSKFNQLSEHITFDKPYRRLWGKDIYNYARLYNDIDVALVPLQTNLFNACKSELKLIEAGFMKKAAIVSNVLPYNTIANNTNTRLINTNDWSTQIRYFINNKEAINDYSDALYDTVKEKYHIKTPTKTRNDLYLWLVNQ